ncbi:SDR family oxidoreductase [Undibacterium parvum]|uniref:SDR family oxidoreductase n=2 Tax=Undibacterium TaxID=401469 RepID=A0A6M4A2Y8_9BURK|nr:SDR family oxidoreductase [Undibacterium parvum]AZP10877.1 SDR family oxidoreductase [Undibacterium parvum]QJQ05453.1 SDR family oxidoreductase [Undibacterium piscinae]
MNTLSKENSDSKNSHPKTIVITGSSSGFGALTAKALAAKGHNVIATMRDAGTRNIAFKAELEAFAKQGGYKLEVVELDVTSDNSVKTAIAAIAKSHGRIDVLLNNAGVMNVGVTEAYSSAELQAQFEVNTFGPARMIRAVLPTMRAQRSGLIVSVTSLAGRVVFPFFGAYNASKFALEALAEAYRYELSGLGIDSVIVEPGPFGTSLLTRSPAPRDQNIVDAYGDIGKIPDAMKAGFQSMYDSPEPPRVEDVTDAIVKLIEQTDKRPLRTVVMPKGMDFGVEKLNQGVSEIQNALLKTMQFDSMI